VIYWGLLLLTVLTLLYGALLFAGAATTGICLRFSVSTIDQPGGYAFTAGVSPCPDPLKEILHLVQIDYRQEPIRGLD